jgi:hypothetical protein
VANRGRKVTEAGYAYIYTLPYWIFTEDDDEKWQGFNIDYKNYIYKIYPPHRQGRLPFLNTPTEIHTKQIPGLRSAENITLDPSFILVPIIGDPLTKAIIWPDGKNQSDLLSLPKDSIRIDILPKTEQAYQPDEANRFLKNLMELVRWKTKQWWIDVTPS